MSEMPCVSFERWSVYIQEIRVGILSPFVLYEVVVCYSIQAPCFGPSPGRRGDLLYFPISSESLGFLPPLLFASC